MHALHTTRHARSKRCDDAPKIATATTTVRRDLVVAVLTIVVIWALIVHFSVSIGTRGATICAPDKGISAP